MKKTTDEGKGEAAHQMIENVIYWGLCLMTFGIACGVRCMITIAIRRALEKE